MPAYQTPAGAVVPSGAIAEIEGEIKRHCAAILSLTARLITYKMIESAVPIQQYQFSMNNALSVQFAQFMQHTMGSQQSAINNKHAEQLLQQTQDEQIPDVSLPA